MHRPVDQQTELLVPPEALSPEFVESMEAQMTTESKGRVLLIGSPARPDSPMRALFVDSIADPSAPTVAELNAGVESTTLAMEEFGYSAQKAAEAARALSEATEQKPARAVPSRQQRREYERRLAKARRDTTTPGHLQPPAGELFAALSHLRHNISQTVEIRDEVQE